jgi:hypothetical protein
MDFAAVIKVIPIWIFRHFLPVIGKFLPGLLGIAGNKRGCFLKNRELSRISKICTIFASD